MEQRSHSQVGTWYIGILYKIVDIFALTRVDIFAFYINVVP